MLGKRHIVLTAALGVLAFASAAEPSGAQSWPQRTVRVITPFPAGSAFDVSARLFADRLAVRWRKPVVVENRPGGDSIVGVATFVAQPDDHTLLFAGSATFTVLPLINEKLPYDAARDLTPISSASDIYIPITVSNSINVASLADLVRHAQAHPGTLNWSAGPGLPQYVFAAFLKSTGLDMVSVSYREVGPAIQDLVEGRLHVTVQSVTAVLPSVRAGKATLLAMASRQRPSFAPDAPTVIEAGYPNLVMDGLSGFFGGRDMPVATRERIAEDIRVVAADPDLQSRLTSVGQTARGSAPTELAAELERSRERIAGIVRLVGARPGH